MRFLDLDQNATTPLLPEVAQALAEALAAGYANPASQHQAGRRARQALEAARDTVGRVLGAAQTGHRGDAVVLTSGGTEANNLALFGLAGRSPGQAIVSAIEHPSVRGPAEELARRGWQIDPLPVDPRGVARLDALADLLRPETRFVALMLVNHETGVVQPVAEAARLCAERGVALHCDAVQAAGKTPVDFRGLGATTLAIAGHKFHGPRGVGALLVREGVELEPLLFGGFQQGGLRPGTEDVPAAVGLARALELVERDGAARWSRLAALRDTFELRLREALPWITVQGAEAARAPHTSNLGFVGQDRQALWMQLDLAGVACSPGSACASGSPERSPVLTAMGCSEGVLAGALRFSFSLCHEAADVALAVERILRIFKHL